MHPAVARRFFAGAVAAVLLAVLPAGTGSDVHAAPAGAAHAAAAHIATSPAAVLAGRADDAASVARAARDRAPLSRHAAEIPGPPAAALLRAIGQAFHAAPHDAPRG